MTLLRNVNSIDSFSIMANKPLKILILILLLFIADFKGIAQTSPADSLKKEQSNPLSLKDIKDKKGGQQEENKKPAVIKKVKGARPDMTKSRGARPTYIERPSGSGIPRGIGKPGGAMKPGKR